MRKFAVFVTALICLLVMGGVVYRVWAQTPAPQTATKSLEDRVKAIIADHLGVFAERVTPAARLREDLKADDLDHVELIMAFEEAFNVSIPDADALKMTRVGDVISYLRERQKK